MEIIIINIISKFVESNVYVQMGFGSLRVHLIN